MDKTKRTVAIVIFAILSLALFIGTIIVKAPSEHGSVGELMKDAVLHETNRVDLLGIIEVNPGLISAFAVTAFFLVFSLAVTPDISIVALKKAPSSLWNRQRASFGGWQASPTFRPTELLSSPRESVSSPT